MNYFNLPLIFMVLIFACVHSFAKDPALKTVEAVYKEKTQLSGTQVKITGQVTKVNANIMGRNFLHIKDGTGSKGTDDLIVTSKDVANIGDKVEIVGTVKLDTDFGYGYKYPLLVEKSSVKVMK